MKYKGLTTSLLTYGSFSQRILGVFSLVLGVALIGSALGVFSLLRVSNETGRMVDETMATERLAGDLQRYISVNVARSKAFALSSEPQVGDALLPEINQTSVLTDELFKKLGAMLLTSDERLIHGGMMDANREFLKARQELTVARDRGLTANIEHVYASRFTPAAQRLLASVTKLGDSQRAKIDAAAIRINELSLSARQGLIVFGICAVLLGAVLSIWLVRGISRPIQEAVDTANRVAALDLTQTIQGHDRDEAGRLLAALGRMQVSLHVMVSQVQGASHHVADGAREIAMGNLDSSGRVELAASFLQQTAAAVEEIATTMHHSLDAASRGEALAKAAALDAARGSSAMSEVMLVMCDMSDSSRQIQEITGVIDGLAFQTNLLALNAAIEAAHAGVHGHGFAVVAAEVRVLASRSAAAAMQIKKLTEASVDKVARGTDKVDQARDAMSAIVESVDRVVHAIGEITAGTCGTSSGIASINASVNRLDEMTQENAAVLEQSAATAQTLQEQAGELRDMANQFRLPRLALA